MLGKIQRYSQGHSSQRVVRQELYVAHRDLNLYLLRSDALPSVKEQLSSVQIKAPIEQLMLGQTGLFRQQNMEKRRTMSVREWAEFCSQPEYRAPSVDEVGIHARTTVKPKTRKTRKSKVTAKDEASDLDLANQVVIKEEPVDSLTHDHILLSHSATPAGDDIKPKVKNNKRQQAKLTEVQKLERDASFLDNFDPALDWLPFSMSPEDYTPEFCAKLERHYWRNLGLGKAPWYGADTQGMLHLSCRFTTPLTTDLRLSFHP